MPEVTIHSDKPKGHIIPSEWERLTSNWKAEYFYDALGRRVAIRITSRGHGRPFLVDYTHLVNQDKILLARGSAKNLTLYLDGQGIDEHFGRVSERDRKIFVSDHLGSVLNSPLSGEFHQYGLFGKPMKDLREDTDFDEPVNYG
jgi:hypothetical protein